jgi:hypothetical protein
MTAKQLWALEPGFQCNTAKGGKAKFRTFFHWRLVLSLFSRYFFLLLPAFVLVSCPGAKMNESQKSAGTHL